ncbi:MAG TPA: hypothetical protein VGK74_05310 [Symbiobacteriaceae bacterium]
MPVFCLWWMQAAGIPLGPCVNTGLYKTAIRPAGPWWWPEAPHALERAVRTRELLGAAGVKDLGVARAAGGPAGPGGRLH